MTEDDPDNPPEMTELEREVVVPRVEEIEDEDLCSIDELIEALDDLTEEGDDDGPEVELDAEDDDLSDIPTKTEIEEELEELKDDDES